MYLRAVALAVVAVALAVATPALAASTGQTITATGTGRVKVKPANRHSNASIAAAEKAAQKASVPLAIADAKTEAEQYASAAGLKLGPLVSISDQVSDFPYGPFFGGSYQQGPFGPGKYCGVIRVPVFKRTKTASGRAVTKIVRFKKEHRCEVPSPVTTTLAVTYSASAT
jgi:uncharacterized protein YggE